MHLTNSFNQSTAIFDRRHKNWGEFQQIIAHRLHVFNGDFADIVAGHIKTKVDPTLWEQIYKKKYEWTAIERLMGAVLERTTKVYSEPAERVFIKEIENGEGDEQFEESENYRFVLDAFKLGDDIDEMMDKVAMLVQVCGIVLVRPWITPKAEAGTRRQGHTVKNTIITPDMFTPIIDDEDPTELAGVTYTNFFTDDQHNKISRTHVFALNDADMKHYSNGLVTEAGYVEIDDDNKIITELTGSNYHYRNDRDEMILPFAVFRLDNEPNRITSTTIGQSLFDGSILASIYGIRKEWILRNQSHKQWLLTGPGASKEGNKWIDPLTPIIIENSDADEVKVELIDLTTDPSTIQDAIDKLYERELVMRGWTLDEFKSSAQRQTAEAQIIQQRAKIEWNNKLITRAMRPGEKMYAEILRIVWNNDSDPSLPQIEKDFTFRIDFGNPYTDSPFAFQQEKITWMGLNAMSIVDIIMDLEPDIQSRDMAMDKLQLNAKENRTAQGVAPETAGITEQAPPPNPEGEAIELDNQIEEAIESETT